MTSQTLKMGDEFGKVQREVTKRTGRLIHGQKVIHHLEGFHEEIGDKTQDTTANCFAQSGRPLLHLPKLQNREFIDLNLLMCHSYLIS